MQDVSRLVNVTEGLEEMLCWGEVKCGDLSFIIREIRESLVLVKQKKVETI